MPDKVLQTNLGPAKALDALRHMQQLGRGPQTRYRLCGTMLEAEAIKYLQLLTCS